MNQQQANKQELLQMDEAITHMDQQIQDDKKVIKQIETSNTWKTSKAYRRLKQMIANDEKVERTQFESIIEELEIALYHADDRIAELQLKDTELTKQAIYQQIRDLKKEGKLLSFLDTLIQDKKQHQQNYREALIYTARLYMQAEDEDQQLLYEKILTGLTIEEIPEFMIRAGLVEDAIPLHQASSFRGSLNMRMRKNQMQPGLPEWPLDDKRTAYRFAQKLEIPTPDIDHEIYTIDTIPVKEGIVLKPAEGAGARGVYLIHATEDIFDVKNSSTLSTWSELIESMQRDLQTGAVEADAWIVEQLVYEDRTEQQPARDIKFYSFYGKVGLILEIVRDPEIRQCWWTVSGERIGTGKYEESLFHGLGVNSEEIAMAEKISSEVPVPFLRIDFLRGENGLVFGEFTPKPGNYDEFDQQTDQLLGDYFLDAEARLIDDLLQGKAFHTYKELVQQTDMMETK